MISSVDNRDEIKPMNVPIIDLSLLSQDSDHHAKSKIMKEIYEASQKWGVFHIINHGISEEAIEEAIEVNQNFFDMPEAMKEISERRSDGMNPVTLVTYKRKTQGTNEIQQRDLLRLHANPFEDFVEFWPRNPSDYREKMGKYTKEVRKIGIQLFGVLMESLNLGATETHLKEKFDQGIHMVVTNNYAPQQESNIKTGAPAHSDHSIMTILLQSSPGLQVLDMADGKWKSVPKLEASLQVFVGDHLEVLSNGIYKSVWHRVIPTTSKTRTSIASFHNFQIDDVVEPATELINDDCPRKFKKGSSLRELLQYAFAGELVRLIDTHRI